MIRINHPLASFIQMQIRVRREERRGVGAIALRPQESRRYRLEIPLVDR